MTLERANMMGRVGRWAMLLGIIGLLVVFAFGFYIASQSGTYYGAAPDVRATARPGTAVGDAFHNVQVTTAWVNGLQFLSIGLLLAGIALQLVPLVSMLPAQGKGIKEAINITGPPVAAPRSEEKKAA